LTSYFIPIVAEQARRSLNLSKIIHLVADTHAKNAHPLLVKEVAHLALQTKYLVDTMVTRLGIQDHYEVVLASDFDATPEYQSLLREVDGRAGAFGNDYFRHEAADIEFFRRKSSGLIKLSWTLDDFRKTHHDERAFDAFYTSIFGEHVSFIYTVSGKRFEKSRRNVSPYVSTPGEARVLIADDSWVSKIGEWKHVDPKTYIHLTNIVFAFEELFGRDYAEDLLIEEKIQKIINRCFF
jgi:hypothetical protein